MRGRRVITLEVGRVFVFDGNDNYESFESAK
jgi:hypothetical protein